MDSTGWPSGSRVACLFLPPGAELSNFSNDFLGGRFVHRGETSSLPVLMISSRPFCIPHARKLSSRDSSGQVRKKRSNNEIKHGYMDPALEEKKTPELFSCMPHL